MRIIYWHFWNVRLTGLTHSLTDSLNLLAGGVKISQDRVSFVILGSDAESSVRVALGLFFHYVTISRDKCFSQNSLNEKEISFTMAVKAA